MAPFVYTDTDIWVNDVSLAAIANEVSLDLTAGTIDTSAFDSAWRALTPGVKSATFSGGGWWDVTTVSSVSPDEKLDTALNTPPDPAIMTVCPTGTAGDTAYLWTPLFEQLTRGGSYGEAAQYSFNGSAVGTVYKGVTSFVDQSITGAANGSSVQFVGGVAATETVAMAVHVTADNGTSLDIILESDDNSGFTTATTRATASISGTTYTYFDTVAGAVTDDYWRARAANLVGTSFTVAVSIGLATTS